MSEIIQTITTINIFSRLKNLDDSIQEETKRIKELNALLQSNEEIYCLAAYSRRNISNEYVCNKGQILQMDARLKEAESYLQEIQEAMVYAISDLMILNRNQLKLNLYISNFIESDKKLLEAFVEGKPIKELVEELNLSERSIKRKKQELAGRLVEMLRSDIPLIDLLEL